MPDEIDELLGDEYEEEFDEPFEEGQEDDLFGDDFEAEEAEEVGDEFVAEFLEEDRDELVDETYEEFGEEGYNEADAMVAGLLGKRLAARFSPVLVRWWVKRAVAPVIKSLLRRLPKRSRARASRLVKGITRCVVAAVLRNPRLLASRSALRRTVASCVRRALRVKPRRVVGRKRAKAAA